MPDPGDVVIANMPGATQGKRRPRVVISSRTYHANRPDVIVGIITSNISAAGTSTDHLIEDWQGAGLTRPSAFRVYLITLGRRDCSVIGHLSPSD